MQPVNGYVWIEPLEKKRKTASGILLAEEKTVLELATVKSSNSDVVSMNDTVVVKDYDMTAVKIEGKAYYFVSEQDIIAIYEKTPL